MKTIKELEAEKKKIKKPKSHQYTNDEWYLSVNDRIRALKDVLRLIDEMNKEGYWNNFKELKKRIKK